MVVRNLRVLNGCINGPSYASEMVELNIFVNKFKKELKQHRQTRSHAIQRKRIA